MKTIQLIFPHQLFENISHLNTKFPVFLVEETLFFNQYKFHKQKITFHRASMQFYKSFLQLQGFEVDYIEATDRKSDVSILFEYFYQEKVTLVSLVDPTDNWLTKRINKKANKLGIDLNYIESLLFLNTKQDLASFFKETKKKFFQTSFYKAQRKQRNILLDGNQKPIGDKWTFDAENRKKYPKGKVPPHIQFPTTTQFYKEAVNYTNTHFKDNYGEVSSFTIYPTSFEGAKKWFYAFLNERFYEFGDYEDAIVKEASILNHSVLSPLLNVGLLSITFVVNESLHFAIQNDIPINSVEGFIRQLIGWREFIRGVYEVKGTEERTKNFWKHTRKIPKSFYNGTTGILPIDQTIKKILKTGYAHHIERLMLLGNIMVLCEFDPDEVYKWFMELFIDAYDWVMVPNVYGMSLFADGGLMSTKPYISSSNYVLKMSDYRKGEWQQVWDGLFWRFMDKHKDFFLSNPRLSMLVRNLEKMNPQTKVQHIENAEQFLSTLNA